MVNEEQMRSLSLQAVIAALMLLTLLLPAEPAAAQQDALLAQCWTAPELAGKAGEKATLRRRAAIDKAALAKVALPAATPPPVVPKLRGSIRSVRITNGRKLIALTFDLCETPYSIAGYDGELVDYLRANDIRATFFASGKWLETHAERAQQLLADSRFEIGSHGLEHRDSRRLAPPRLEAEIRLTRATYQRVREKLSRRACVASTAASRGIDGAPAPALAYVPEHLSLFRFPYGTCSAASLKAVGDAGFLAIQWDVVSGDPDRARSPRAIAATILARTRPGSIIVAHANGRGWNTAAALPLVIPELRKRGFEFVTVSELLAAGEPVIANSCYETRPGDYRHFHLSSPRNARPKAKAKHVLPVFQRSAD